MNIRELFRRKTPPPDPCAAVLPHIERMRTGILSRLDAIEERLAEIAKTLEAMTDTKHEISQQQGK